MSWSVVAHGRAGAVRKEIARQFASGSKCTEPEETVRQAAIAIMDAALAAQQPTAVVKASASGSQSGDYSKQLFNNQLNITVEPQYGFLEE